MSHLKAIAYYYSKAVNKAEASACPYALGLKVGDLSITVLEVLIGS
jgi:hypothetical protein